MVVTLITSITVSYFILTLIFIVAWKRMPYFLGYSPAQPLTFVSVIVAVRNEEDTILQLLGDLSKQSYPTNCWEVIIVDDHSTDRTAAVIRDFIAKASFSCRFFSLNQYVTEPLLQGNYKKKALEVAVEESKGELIISTDGDCRVREDWISLFQQFYVKTGAKFICGGVSFYGEKTVFEKLQTVEFASLVGSGAATLSLGMATMCNGANLAYSKEAFGLVGGYKGVDGTPSGDDIFLLTKIEAVFPKQAFFLKNEKAIVHTKAQPTWKAFYHQRKRWASKWNYYQDIRITLLAFFVFLCNFSLVIALAGVLFGNYPLGAFLLQIAIKLSVEFVFLTFILNFFNKRNFIPWIIPLQFIYFLYVSFFGLISQKKGYQWKGRELK